MNDHSDPLAGPLKERDETPDPEAGDPVFVDATQAQRHGYPNGRASRNGHTPKPKVDPLEVVRLLSRRWPWFVMGGLLGAAAFFALGNKVIKEKHTARAQLLRYETPGATDFFPVISPETFVALIRSPELLAHVGQQVTPPIAPEKFAKIFKVEPEYESDVINIALAARSPQQAVELLNLYTSNAVVYARQYYSQHADTVAKNYLRKQLEEINRDIATLEERFRGTAASPFVTDKFTEVSGELNKLNTSLANAPAASSLVLRQRERLDKALGELDELLSRYTEIHPRVIEKKAQIQGLEQQISSSSTNKANICSAQPLQRTGSDFNPEADLIRTKLLALEDGRVHMANKQREAALYAEDPPGIVRVFAPANLKTVQKNHYLIKIGVVSAFGAGVGIFLTLLLAMLVEFADNRVKTSDDLKRVTRLPFLTSLGDLNSMGADARSQWAFRTWTMLQGRLSPSANHGLVCGITSSKPGEGRTTWIRLLAEAASLTGFRVLTIATRPTTKQLKNGDNPSPEAEDDDADANNPSQLNSAITTSVLAAPGQVTAKLTGPNPEPMVHIPLPGWVWNLDRRRQWGEALNQWRQIDNLVILVELPPASVPESVLLGSNLPNMIWLSDSGKADAAETRDQLETLRHARCNLVGTVLNREIAAKLRKRFSRWVGLVALTTSLATSNAQAQDQGDPVLQPAVPSQEELPTPAHLGFSISKPAQRAEWQKRLTLGPGDVLTIGLFGEPDSLRTEVAVGPDGRLSFLEASDILVTGKSIDELRTALDEELGKYRRAARAVITPVSFKSKRYYMLGRVMTKGVYVLDRPITVLEAIARAHGLENALVERNLVDLADFQRSFIARKGQRIPINFERLFQQGDLSQNIAIEPDDYLYIAAAEVQEVYVVGEIRLPGPVVFSPDLTVIGAITGRGGYTERAFKSRVVVIRGSLNKPEALVVDTRAILQGNSLDFKLQPKDIIYVNSRPFIRVEELADLAATAFIQSIITEWVGVAVVKPIQ